MKTSSLTFYVHARQTCRVPNERSLLRYPTPVWLVFCYWSPFLRYLTFSLPFDYYGEDHLWPLEVKPWVWWNPLHTGFVGALPLPYVHIFKLSTSKIVVCILFTSYSHLICMEIFLDLEFDLLGHFFYILWFTIPLTSNFPKIEKKYNEKF